MSFLRIWVHLVFSTKNREPNLSCEVRLLVIKHIIENCKKKNIFLQAIGGYSEHLHCLISLGCQQSVAEVARLIKGESSNWINKKQFVLGRFAWQDDYFAVSVSESLRAKVENYIKKQEEHHRTKPFNDEIKELMNKYGRLKE